MANPLNVLFKRFWWSLPKSESKGTEKDSRFRQSWSRWVLLASIRDSHFSASSTLGEVGWPVLVDGLRAEETSITARLLWEILADLRFQDNFFTWSTLTDMGYIRFLVLCNKLPLTKQLKTTLSFAHSSVGQKSGSVWPDSLLKKPQSRNQGVRWATS